jgi:YidC/Oxa1 family membrane protein insertase
MQQKNFIVFLVLSLAILVGWSWLQMHLWPPKPPEKKDTDQVEEQAKKPAPLPRNVGAALAVADRLSGAPGITDAVWLAALARGVTDVFPRLETPAVAKAPEKKEKPPAPTEAKARDIPLGGAGYHIQAVLTTRGAGVKSLTLTQFKAADRDGRPVYQPGNDGTKEAAPLNLIPEDPWHASFCLYHFPTPGDEKTPPVTTLGELVWDAKDGGDKGEEGHAVTFTATVPGYDHLVLSKTYTLKPREYHIGLELKIEDKRDRKSKGEAQVFRYQLAGAHGVPIEGQWYTYTYRNAYVGIVDDRGNLWRTMEDSRRISHMDGGDRVPEAARGGGDLIQYGAIANQYFASAIVVDNQQAEGVQPRDIVAWVRPTLESRQVGGKITRIDLKRAEIDVLPRGDVAVTMTYRLLPRAIGEIEAMKLSEGDQVLLNVYDYGGPPTVGAVNKGSNPRPFLDDITVRVNSDLVQLRPGESRVHKFLLYHGPIKVRLLATDVEGVDPALVERYADTLHLATMTDYHSDSPFGTFASKVGLTTLFIACTKLMHWLLHLILLVVRFEGLSIIVLTVIVRGLMFPISRRQAQMSMKMQALAPELKKVQEKYKNDPQARTAAMMELYRKHGVNPLGSCLPLLLQMPVFLGLYWALQESIRFRLAPFLWIENLAAPDMLLWWSDRIPWVSDPNNMGGALGFPASFFYLGPYLNVLPVLAVALMWGQQKMMMPPPTDEQQVMQQKMMRIMTVVMGVIFYKVAAGLCIYFIASSAWGFAERRLLPKKQTAAGAAPGGAGPSGGGGKGPTAGGKGPSGRGKGKGKKPAEDARFQKVRSWWAEILKQAKKK